MVCSAKCGYYIPSKLNVASTLRASHNACRGDSMTFSTNVFKGIKLLNTSLWPSDHDGLQQFWQKELSLIVDHFRPLLLKNASIDSIFSEWEAFKVFGSHNLASMTKDEVWSTLLTKLKSKYPNLAT